MPSFAVGGIRGTLVRPIRFLPSADFDHVQKSFAWGPRDIASGTSEPDMSGGNYGTGWVAYLDGSGSAYLQKKLTNGLWDGQARSLLTLVGGIKKISLEFAPSGYVILGYLRPTGEMGVWWRNTSTSLPALLDLGLDIQDILLGVENKDDPTGTDVFLWYFRGGELFLRKHSEAFATETGPYVSGLTNPVIIQAGINHRYGYQVDYRDDI